jgi:S-adenosylmethionine decarboxylase
MPPTSRRFHLIVDAYGCDHEQINDIPQIEQFVTDVAEKIDMHILSGPTSVQGIPENPGVTCFTIIDFSHISIHTFTDSDEFYLDIFSCKPFDHTIITDFITETFGITNDQIRAKVIENA